MADDKQTSQGEPAQDSPATPATDTAIKPQDSGAPAGKQDGKKQEPGGPLGDAPEPGSERLRSVHTTNLPEIFRQLRCSLLVTTYQAGKLVMVRPDGEQSLNTHFRTFKKPMGMAVGRNRLALGTQQEIWDFRNVPAVCPKIEPKGQVDACFLPRSVHVTGDIQIHEMVFQEEQLWFINTAFSCLCTLDADHSFVPRWRPPFIKALAPGDRCHLNGLGLMNGKPKWVTALGTSDEPGGWRENKKAGGIIMDLDSNEIVCRGLSMPHSPRWYADKLWVLESGTGSFGTVDLQTGRYDSIIQLPGFTRGLDFMGNLAFIGLSQVRETAIFSGISITETLKETERNCGVWAVDIRNGQLVGFLKFEDAVQEIFAVSVVSGAIYPDLINADPEITGASFVLPDEALKDVPTALRKANPEAETPASDEAKPAEADKK